MFQTSRHSGTCEQYVIRTCGDDDTAAVSAELCAAARYWEGERRVPPLPRVLGRRGAEIVVEYLRGRDLTADDVKWDEGVPYGLGRLYAAVHFSCARVLAPAGKAMDHARRLSVRLNELVSDMFTSEYSLKAKRAVAAAAARHGKSQPPQPPFDPVLTAGEADALLRLYKRLLAEVGVVYGWDLQDCIPANFRVTAPEADEDEDEDDVRLVFVDLEGLRWGICCYGALRAMDAWMSDVESQQELVRGFRDEEARWVAGDTGAVALATASGAHPLEDPLLADLVRLESRVAAAHYKAQLPTRGGPLRRDLAVLRELLARYSAGPAP
eukprot:TRINITY_DN3002_c0_g1_i1.p1 TRINITY_DN3002_c0_g1~~TRINITY_DN3002_c0_g1_i1.p1  ORF type:complete len:325 (-),score=84.91 TRINITY_DN3002_c0_g1_i1:123-1097(-)